MATPLSDERLAEIRERCDKATQGPWELEIKGADAAPLVIVWARYPHREGLHRHFITYTEYGEKPDPDVLQRNSDNYAFIAAARADMPDLLDEVERLRRLEEAVTTMPPDTRYTPQVAGRLLWHWEQGFRHDNHTQMVEWLAGIRRALEASDDDATE